MKEKAGAKAKSSGDKKISFEKALEELESIVEKMESGKLSLEESLKLFQDGIENSKICREILAEAEYRVEYLLKEELEKDLSEEGERIVKDES